MNDMNETTRLQTHLEFQQHKVKWLNTKYDDDMSCTRLKGGKASEVRAFVFCDFQYYFKRYLSWKAHWISSSRSEDIKKLTVSIN